MSARSHVSVPVEISSEAEHMRLVHADMTFLDVKFSASVRNLFVRQPINVFPPAEKDVVTVDNVLVALIARDLVDMRERLDTRAEFHADRSAKVVHFLDLGLRISAAADSRNKGCLSVRKCLPYKDKHMYSPARRGKKRFFHRFHFRNGVSRTVNHDAQIVESVRL